MKQSLNPTIKLVNKAMTVNGDRLWAHVMELGKIGEDEQGGVTRFSFTELERQAKQQVKSYMTQAGMRVREDAAGNLIGLYEGTDTDAPVVVTGSHIDTVKHGGKFDGALGVLAAIEAVHMMHENGIQPKHSIEVVAFSDEEGSRFGFGMIGSRAFAGTLKQENLLQRDEQGVSIAEAMQNSGFDSALIAAAARQPEQIKGYVELHIEQGKVLEQLDQPVGIVTGIAGPLWLQFTLIGQAGHAGATPMPMRRDPLQAATVIFDFIYRETSTFDPAVATVGKLHVLPGGVNIIPGEVQFSLDLRHIDEAQRDELEQRIRSFTEQICMEQSIEYSIELLQRVPPAPSSPEIISSIHQAAELAGLSNIPQLVSGAGHDGMQFHSLCPIGMIFVRSKDGISHHPDEWSSKEDCAAGTSLLYYTLLQLAEGE